MSVIHHSAKQRGIRFYQILLSAALLSASSVLADDFFITRKGYAYSPDGKTLLYVEAHRERWENDRRVESELTYYDATDKIIARKQVSFRKSSFAPDFKLEDLRDGYTEGAENQGKKVRVFARRNKDKALQEKEISIPAPAVIDAGFNEYVLAQWDKLRAGDTLKFNFVAPIEQDYFSFTTQKIADTQVNGIDCMVLEMKPASAFVRLFVKPIKITYTLKDRHLFSFEGMTNLNDNKGKSHVAKLTYPPHDVKRQTMQATSDNDSHHH